MGVTEPPDLVLGIGGLFFRGQVFSGLAADPRRLGAQIGFTAVLHTWGQNLLFHPHLHCVVTGGGLSPDGARWTSARQRYLLPVKVLGKLFRGKFLAGLQQAYRAGELRLTGSTASLATLARFRRLLGTLYRRAWVVYSKPPFGAAEQVYRYFGRYTHRVAISNARLVSLEEGQVRFRYKDYADGSVWKAMRLSADEFLRRFLLHVLPKRFVRIRHYGLLASRNVNTRLARCRELLTHHTPPSPSESNSDADVPHSPEPECCPHCQGPLQRWSWEAGSAPRATTVAADVPAGACARLLVNAGSYPTNMTISCHHHLLSKTLPRRGALSLRAPVAPQNTRRSCSTLSADCSPIETP